MACRPTGVQAGCNRAASVIHGHLMVTCGFAGHDFIWIYGFDAVRLVWHACHVTETCA